jgi:hypothetical protein
MQVKKQIHGNYMKNVINNNTINDLNKNILQHKKINKI